MDRPADGNEQEIQGFARGQGSELVVLLHAYVLGPGACDGSRMRCVNRNTAPCDSSSHRSPPLSSHSPTRSRSSRSSSSASTGSTQGTATAGLP